MPLINDNDIVSDGALNRPKELGDNLDRVYNALLKILKAAKESEAAIISSKSTSKISDETQKLTRAQKELAKEQEKAAKIAKTLWLSENEVALAQQRATESSKKLTSVTSDLDKKMAAAANSATAYTKSQKDSNDQSSKAQTIYKAEAGSLEALTQKRIQLKNAIESQKKNQQDDNDLLKKGIISRAEFNKRIAESEGVIAKNNIGIQSLNNQIKNHILSTGSLGGEYKKLTIQLESARTKYKDLAASGTATSKQLKDQESVFNALNKKVTAIDKTVGQFQRNVGNYPATFQAATQSVTRFLSAFGIVTGIALVAKGIKDVIGLNVQFEQSNSRLQGILGATKEEIKVLREEQIKLGETTAFTASQYADLQIELAKLGFPINDIKLMTESTANAAIALGSELAPQAELTGSAIRAFGLQAKDATMVNDELAKSTSSSALNFEKLATGLPYVAASANKLGFSLNETLALMGELSNQGLQSSTIGTSLRSLFLKLADSSSNLSKKFKEPIRDLPSLLKGLKQLQKEGIDLGDALELTDVRSVTAFASLIKGSDSVEKLSETIKNADGFAKQLADTVRDNLGGDFILLTSAAQELGRELGESVDGVLRRIVKTATVFIQVLKELPSFVKDNKVEFYALGAAILAFNSGAIIASATTLGLQLRTIALAAAQRVATISTRSLTIALAANPIGAIILAFAALAVAIDAYDRNSRRALEVENKRNELNKGIVKQTELVTKAQKDLSVSVEEWLKLSDSQKRAVAEQIEFTINHEKAMISRLKVQKLELASTAEELTLWQKTKLGLSALAGTFGAASTIANKYVYAAENSAEATKGIDDNIVKLESEIDKLTHTLDDNTAAQAKNTQESKKAAKERALAQLELDKFRVEQQIKVQDDIAVNEKKSLDERLTASVEAEKLRVKLVGIEKKKELLDDTLISEQKTLISEKEEAGKTDAARKGKNDRDKITDEELKKQYELGAKQIKADEELALQRATNLIENSKYQTELEVSAIQERYLAGKISKEKADKEILNSQNRNNQKLIDLQIQTLQEQLTIDHEVYYDKKKKLIEETFTDEAEKIVKLQLLEAESEKEKSDIIKRLHDLRVKMTDDAFNNQVGKYDEEIKELQKVQSYYQQYSQAINEIYQNIAASRIAALQKESDANAAKLEKDLKSAGDNEAFKDKLRDRAAKKEAELEKKRRSEAIKAARLEKVLAIAEAGIRTSLTVLNALSTVKPYPAAVVAAVSAGVLGAAQIAAIASKPIPAYELGTKSAQGGLALVGEKGAELMYSPSGQVSLTPEKPTIMDVPRGTEIVPHKETIRMLALGAISQNGGISQNKNYDPELLNEVRQLNVNIKKIKPAQIPDLVVQNANVYSAIKSSENHTKLRRSINLGRWVK